MNIFETLTYDMKEAMKAKETVRVAALRGAFAAIKSAAIDAGERENISDEVALQILKRQVKQRKDSIDQFRKGGRDDLANQEQAELAVLENYLPEMLSEEAIKNIALQVKEELNIQNASQMGMMMGAVMKKLQGQEVDGTVVKLIVTSLLQ